MFAKREEPLVTPYQLFNQLFNTNYSTKREKSLARTNYSYQLFKVALATPG